MPAGKVASDIEKAPPVVSAVAFMTAVLAPAAMRSPSPGRKMTAFMAPSFIDDPPNPGPDNIPLSRHFYRSV
jgi:hypothetical protein